LSSVGRVAAVRVLVVEEADADGIVWTAMTNH
jgi:hypothetical protein